MHVYILRHCAKKIDKQNSISKKNPQKDFLCSTNWTNNISTNSWLVN